LETGKTVRDEGVGLRNGNISGTIRGVFVSNQRRALRTGDVDHLQTRDVVRNIRVCTGNADAKSIHRPRQAASPSYGEMASFKHRPGVVPIQRGRQQLTRHDNCHMSDCSSFFQRFAASGMYALRVEFSIVGDPVPSNLSRRVHPAVNA
jgi:hypothetical protein